MGLGLERRRWSLLRGHIGPEWRVRLGSQDIKQRKEREGFNTLLLTSR
jgi:hypothetical protein